MQNTRIADHLEEIADLIELQDGSRFRVRSFRNAARTVRNHSKPVQELVENDEDLTELPSIGESTADDIAEIVETGTCERLEKLRSDTPRGTTELMRVPGLGPKRAMEIHQELDVSSLDDLREACEDHRVRELDGFGEKTEQKILEGIDTLEETSNRILLRDAREYLAELAEFLDGLDELDRWEVAGSYRRGKETVGDLDILIAAGDRDAAVEAILEHESIDEVISKGTERTSVRLDSGLQVDFRFFDEDNFGAALLYFTGSKSHNIELRKRARKHDWKLSEYGLTKGDETLAASDEEGVYHRLDLKWIPPELRESRGEIEAAEDDDLPDLVERDDLRGDLHSHTDATDGKASIDDMARAARDRGLEYFAITDHSQRVSVAGGLDEKALRKHVERIREADGGFDDLWLLAGVECDILKDGELDLDEDLLADLDWVVGSIHYDQRLDEDENTDRLLKAIESGVVHAIGHPLNRKIGSREPIRFDFEAVAKACVEHDVVLEINCQPDRLDLPDNYCKRARELGVRFSIATDAHEPDSLDNLDLGVTVARRGWLTKDDVVNCLTAKQFRDRLGKIR